MAGVDEMILARTQIVEMTENHLSEVVSIHCEVFTCFDDEPIEKQDFRRHFVRNPNALKFVALLDGKVIGYIVGKRESPMSFYLEYFAIEKNFRGKGIGLRLMSRFIVEAERIGGMETIIRLHTTTDEKIIKMYERYNFQRASINNGMILMIRYSMLLL